MASLADLKKSLNIIDISTGSDLNQESDIVLGKKRRPWVDDGLETSNSREQHASDYVSKSTLAREQHESDTIDSLAKESIKVSNSLAGTLANKFKNVSGSLAAREQKSIAETTNANDINILLSTLSGHERKLVRFIFKQCQATASFETNLISSDEIKEYMAISSIHLRNLIYRLSKKGLFKVTFFIKNKSGIRKFLIDSHVFNKLNYDENIINTLDAREQLVSNSLAEKNNLVSHNVSDSLAGTLQSTPSSSSLKQSTTKEEGRGLLNTIELPLDWQAIDFTSLEFIGFNLNKLQQIYQAQADNFTAEMIQNSLYAFAFDMEVNNIIYKSPINFIMSQLKVKGIPYDFPANYESPRIRAMRLYQERLAAQTQRETELRDNLKRSCFDAWLASVPTEEQNKLVPKGDIYTKEGPRRGALFSHFEQAIWPDKEKAILAGMSA